MVKFFEGQGKSFQFSLQIFLKRWVESSAIQKLDLNQGADVSFTAFLLLLIVNRNVEGKT